jgi:hypothetical protein
MRTLITACVAGALAGCAALTGEIDDGGRVFRETQNSPVDSNLEPLAAEPSIPIISDRFPVRGAGDDSRTGGEPASGCEAEMWQHLIGRTVAEVEAEDLPEGARVIEWGAITTQEYLPARMNVHLDQQGRVYRVICG